MTPETFQALVVREIEPKRFARRVETRSISDLPPGDVLIRVQFSSLNFKDALSASGRPGVTSNYPHTPGIDAAGVVEASDSDQIVDGDEVVVIGHDLGMDTSGGFGEYVRVPAGWVVKLPSALTPRDAMIYGTAGFTAAMCIDRIRDHGVKPEDGEILVTGATGGVGSFGVALLAHLGYRVVAATGKIDEAQAYLRGLGAENLMSRGEATDESRRPLLKGRWAAVVDTVGGKMLASALKSARPGAAVTVCGLAASPALETTVLPFILRGITMYGVNSVPVPHEERRRLWELLAGDWRPQALDLVGREVALAEVEPEIERILNGEQTGRVLVRLQPGSARTEPRAKRSDS